MEFPDDMELLDLITIDLHEEVQVTQKLRKIAAINHIVAGVYATRAAEAEAQLPKNVRKRRWRWYRDTFGFAAEALFGFLCIVGLGLLLGLLPAKSDGTFLGYYMDGNITAPIVDGIDPLELLDHTLDSSLSFSNKREITFNSSHYTYNTTAALSKRMFGPIITSGAASNNGTNPLRLELRQLQENEEQWNLYVLALDWLQFQPQDEDLSWYGISGIHGRPYIAFDGVGPAPGTSESGYCTHVSEIFLTWHRPYLALFEQRVVQLAKTIASLYIDPAKRQRYEQAAKTLRLPYWDWAVLPSNDTVFPSAVASSPIITVYGPSGAQDIANPLYSYFFQPLNSTDLPDPPMCFWNQTMRDPSSVDSDAISNDAGVVDLFQTYYKSIQGRVYNLLTDPVYSNFSVVGTEYYASSNPISGLDSLEAVHDTVHGIAGANGHMSYIQYSAMDPIFMLHHANVDRLFAMWQVLNPDSYVVAVKSNYATYTNPAGQIQDMDTELTPFRAAPNVMWTSATVRDTSVFNYGYEDTANPHKMSEAELQSRVRGTVNRLYGDSAASGPQVKRGVESNASLVRFSVNMVAYKDGLAGPYSVHVYFDGNVVALNYVNAHLHGSSKISVSASVPLIDLPTNINASILYAGLTFKVISATGHKVAPAVASDLVNITLISSVMTLTDGFNAFPVWSTAMSYGKIAVAAI